MPTPTIMDDAVIDERFVEGESCFGRIVDEPRRIVVVRMDALGEWA